MAFTTLRRAIRLDRSTCGRTRSILALLALLATVACGGDEPADAAGAPMAPTPEAIASGLLPAVLLEDEPVTPFAILERMAHYNVPGVSVAVMQNGEVAWAQAWGMADPETGAPVSSTTLFQAASISKPVAALVALSLVDDGTIDLDAPVNDYLKAWEIPDNEFTADSAVTLRGILTHSAGLTVWGFPGYRKDRPFADGQEVASNAQVLDGLGNTDSVRVYKVPGTSWQYSGGGYTVMEQVVEDVTGQPFQEAARARVLEPAGMTRSTYEQPLPPDRWPEAARGHGGDGSEVEGEWHSYPEQAAAGLWTTPTELLTLSAHLLDIRSGAATDGVLSAPLVDAMLTPNHPGDEAFQGWGLGFALNGEGDAFSFGHGGSNAGFRAQWTVLPERGQGVVVMTNGDRGSALAGEIIRALAVAWDWPVLQPETRGWRRLEPEALADYSGTYRMDGGDLVVTVRPGDGVLAIDVAGQGEVTAYADAQTEDTFFDAEDGQVITFVRDEAGAVTGIDASGATFSLQR